MLRVQLALASTFLSALGNPADFGGANSIQLAGAQSADCQREWQPDADPERGHPERMHSTIDRTAAPRNSADDRVRSRTFPGLKSHVPLAHLPAWLYHRVPTLAPSGLVGTWQRDRPLERTGRQQSAQIDEAFHNEAASGAREPTRPPCDSRRFHKVEDDRGRRWSGYSGEVAGQHVTVGRGERKRPDRSPRRGIHTVRYFQREPAQEGSVTRAL